MPFCSAGSDFVLDVRFVGTGGIVGTPDFELAFWSPPAPLCLFADLGLRLRVRARLSRSESESFSSPMESGAAALFAAADRVTGAKYVSPGSRLSDCVGVGAMMLGVLGIWYCWAIIAGLSRMIQKGGKDGDLIRPATSRGKRDI